jgi:hypothetical protein
MKAVYLPRSGGADVLEFRDIATLKTRLARLIPIDTRWIRRSKLRILPREPVS